MFRDGDEIELASRNERPFTRYFPELLEPLRAALPERCVVDGEIVVPTATAAGSTSTRCSSASTPPSRGCACWPAETPASFVAFDLLALGDDVAARRAVRASGAALLERCCAADAPRAPHAGDAPTGRRRATGSRASRAPDSTA